MAKDAKNTKIGDTIRIYQWLISVIKSRGHIGFSDLGKMWESEKMADGYPLSRTTFNRYRDGIKEVYGLEILCMSSGKYANQYYIRNAADLNDDSSLLWSYNVMALNTLLYKYNKIRRRISIDQYFCMDHLDVILECIEQRKLLLAFRRISNKDKNQSQEVVIKPYGLVLRHNEWFIIGKNDEEQSSANIEIISEDEKQEYQYYMVSAFEAMVNTERPFTTNKYFKLHKAISMSPEYRCSKTESARQEIILMANSKALAKIKSQTSLLYNVENYGLDSYRITLYTFGEETIDFILSLGADVQVISPEDIRELVREKVVDLFQVYCNTKAFSYKPVPQETKSLIKLTKIE